MSVWRPSIRLAVSPYLEGRAKENLDIQRRLPLTQVIEVVFDPRFHFLKPGRLATTTVNLGKSGDTRQHLVPDHVALDQLAVLLIVGDRVRSRSHQAHAPRQHVEKLGQLVEREAPQELADAREALVVTGRLPDVCAVLGDRHGAEFINVDNLAIEAVAALAEDYRTRRTELDQQAGDEQERRQQDDRQDADADIH